MSDHSDSFEQILFALKTNWLVNIFYSSRRFILTLSPSFRITFLAFQFESLVFTFELVFEIGSFRQQEISIDEISMCLTQKSQTCHQISSSPTFVTDINKVKKLCQHRHSIGIQMCNSNDRETFSSSFFFWYHFGDRSGNRTR